MEEVDSTVMKALSHTGITTGTLNAIKHKEHAAIAMCGGLLGNCYLMAEIIENMIINIMPKFKKQKWFRQKIKFSFNKAQEELHKTIFVSIKNSPTNADYMREMADVMYDMLKMDIFKLKNAVNLELNKLKVSHVDELTDMITVNILFQCILIDYDSTLEYMKSIFDCYYDTWYHNAKCEQPARWWNDGVQEFAKTYIPVYIDLNGIQSVIDGIVIIQKKLHSAEVAKKASELAMENAEEGLGKDIYDNSLKILGIA